MKRELALVGSIIGTCFSAIFLVIMLIGSIFIFGLLDSIGSLNGSAILSLLIVSVEIATIVATLVLNIVTIVKSTNVEKMKKKSPIIATIVFIFLSVGIVIYSLISAFNVVNLIIGMGLSVAGVLMIIDLCTLKKGDNLVKPQVEVNNEDIK